MVTHFPNYPNWEICKRDKDHKGSLQNTHEQRHTLRRTVRRLDYRRPQVPNEEGESRNNHRHAIIVLDLATQRTPVQHTQNKNFTRDDEKLTEVPESQSNSEKNTHTHTQFGQACEDLGLGIMVRQLLTDLRHVALQSDQCARLTKGP